MSTRAGSFFPSALAIFAFALALRALHLWQLRDSPFLEAELGDAVVYLAWGRRIAAGDWLGSEVFFQSPLYPYWLGAIFATFGDHPLLVRSLQCVLSAAACGLLASAAARLFSPGAGLAAGLLLATYAPSIFLDALLQKSVFDVFFVCLALWLAAGIARGPRLGRAGALGLAVGLLAIARENALILAGVLGLWLLALPAVAGRRRLALAGVFVAGLAAALLPVALRNFRVGGELHLTTSQLGMNLYIGNHPGAPGFYQPLDPSHGVETEPRGIREMAERAVGRPLSPSEVSDYWTGQALHYVRSQPLDWLALMLRKLLLFLSAVELVDAEDQYLTSESSLVLRAAGWLGHFGVLAPLALLGGFVTWPRRRELWWIHAAIAAYAASVLVFYVVTRYRYPLVPFLALLAGAGLAGLRPWLASRSRREVALPAALVMGLALVSNGVSGPPKHSMAAVTHANLGHFYRKEGQPARAVLHYEKARGLEPGLPVQRNLAAALLELGRSHEARAILEEASAADPRDAALHASLARLLREQGEPERALAHYHRALELAPGDEEVRRELVALHVERAAALRAQDDASGALAHYRSALALDPRAPAALWGAAALLANEPDAPASAPGEALALAERAAAGAPRLTPAMLETLAAAYAAVGRFEEALERAREAAALHAAAGRPVPERLAQALARYDRREPLRAR